MLQRWPVSKRSPKPVSQDTAERRQVTVVLGPRASGALSSHGPDGHFAELLSGEAGIGKSRLTAALLERVASEPNTRLRYFCSAAAYRHGGAAMRKLTWEVTILNKARCEVWSSVLPDTDLRKSNFAQNNVWSGIKPSGCTGSATFNQSIDLSQRRRSNPTLR